MTDSPVPPPTASASPTAPDPGAAPAVAADAYRPPAWTWPARIVARLHRPLRASIRPDVAFIGRQPIPNVQLVAPAVAIAVPLVFSLLRLTITDVFTESLVFMSLAVAIGLVAPALGVLFVLAHAVFDLVATVGRAYVFSPLDYLLIVAGRAVSFYLLWLLVVEFPLIARAIPWLVMESPRPADQRTRRLFAAASAGAAAAFMTFVWTQAAPWLMRPVFTWTNAGAPTDQAIMPVQVWGGIVVAVAGVVAAGTAWRRLMAAEAEHPGAVEFEDLEDYDLGELEAEPGEGLGFIQRLASHLFAVFVLGGLVTGIVDLVLLGAAALAAQPVAMRVLRVIPGLRRTLVAVPWILRFAVGFGISFGLGAVITGIIYQPVLGSEFFPLVITITIGLLLFHVLLGAEEAEERAERAAERAQPAAGPTGGVATAVIAGLAVGIGASLLWPAATLAGNCSGLGDCGPALAAAGGAAAAAAAAAVAVAAADSANRRRARRVKRRRKAAAEAPEGESGVVVGQSGVADGQERLEVDTVEGGEPAGDASETYRRLPPE